jgi:uroporphyrinogen decarboxylase
LSRYSDVVAALEHRQPTKVPYQISFTPRAAQSTAKYLGDPDFYSKIGNSLTVINCMNPGGMRRVAAGIWEDEFGVQWNRSVDHDIGVVCNRVITPDNIEEYRFPDPDEPSRFVRYQDIRSRAGDTYIVSNIGFSLFERAWTMAGMQEVLMAMVIDKEFAHRLLDRILEFNLRLIDNACQFDIDAMRFGDDWGDQRGLIMGPDLWREFIRPRIAQMYERVKSHGKRVFIHSCGRVDSIFPDLIECGVDVFNPFQPEVMDVFEAKAKYGADLSFYGGISVQQTLPFGTRQQVRDEVRRLLDVVGEGGGYIASPSHAIPGDAKPENIAVMLEALQEQ